MHESRKDLRACADLIGRAAIAKQFNKGKTTVTNWYNEDSPVPTKVWAFSANTLELDKNKNGKGIGIKKLERIVGISLDHLQERDFSVSPPLKSAPILQELPHFERFKASKSDPAWKVKRRGRSVNISKNEAKMCATQHTLKGRILDYIRKKYGLGGKVQYQQTEEIEKSQREDLMQAVDNGLIEVRWAYVLLTESRERTAELLLEGRLAVFAFIRKKRAEKKQSSQEVHDDLKK